MSVDWFNVFLQAAFRFLHAQGRGFPGTELAYDHACGLPGRFPVREGHLARESGDEGLVYDNGIAAAYIISPAIAGPEKSPAVSVVVA